jgi:hypothetical protein
MQSLYQHVHVSVYLYVANYVKYSMQLKQNALAINSVQYCEQIPRRKCGHNASV